MLFINSQSEVRTKTDKTLFYICVQVTCFSNPYYYRFVYSMHGKYIRLWLL